MRRRRFIGLLGGATAWPLAARAQQSERMRHIGVLMSLPADDPEAQARVAAFQQGLQQLGWIVAIAEQVSVLNAPKLNWSEAGLLSAYGVDVDATINVSVGAAAIGLDLGGGLVLAGGFSFTTSSGVPVDDGALSPVATFTADVMQVTVSNAHLFAGVGGSLSGADSTTVTDGSVGLSASGINVHLVTAKNTATLTKYTGLYLTVGSATLTGLDPIEVHLKDAFVKYNKVSVLECAQAQLERGWALKRLWSDVDATIDVSVGAAAIGLNLGGGLVLAGGFSFTTSSAVLVDDKSTALERRGDVHGRRDASDGDQRAFVCGRGRESERRGQHDGERRERGLVGLRDQCASGDGQEHGELDQVYGSLSDGGQRDLDRVRPDRSAFEGRLREV